MGIQDRDYYWERERQRQAPRKTTAAARRQRWNSGSNGRHALVWILIAAALALAVKLGLVLRSQVPFPDAGTVHWYIGEPTGPTAALTLKAPALKTPAHFVVKLDQWETHAPIALVPVPSGRTTSLQMPLGRYRMTVIKGVFWQGPEKLFAYETYANESVHPVEFYRVGNSLNGKVVELETMLGNMEMRGLKGVW